MRPHKALWLLLVAALCACACGRSPGGWTQDQLVGGWDLQRIEFRGPKSPIDGPTKGYITLNKDGSFEAKIDGMTPAHTPLDTPYRGTWSFADGKLATNVKSSTTRATATREGGLLVLQWEDSNSFTFFYSKKQ